MPFVRTSAAPERQFLYGSPGAGKTAAAFSIARKLAVTNSPARMHLVDTDNAYYDMIDEYPEAADVMVPIIVDQEEEGREWLELDEAIRKALKDADPNRGDWIVVDRIDPAWEWAQDLYVREVKARSIDDTRAEGRRKVASGEDKNLRAGLQGFEWGEVKTRFRKPITRLTVSGCNIIVTAGESKISSYTDASGDTKEQFGGLPWAPAGGAGTKLLAHMFRDIFHLRCINLSKGEYVISTAKARARKRKLSNQKISDYSFDVLVKVCGWRNRGGAEEEG